MAKRPVPKKDAGHAPNTGRPKATHEYKMLRRGIDPGDVVVIDGWHVHSVVSCFSNGSSAEVILWLEKDA